MFIRIRRTPKNRCYLAVMLGPGLVVHKRIHDGDYYNHILKISQMLEWFLSEVVPTCLFVLLLIFNFWKANTAQIKAVIVPVATENHSCSVAIVAVIIVTMIEFRMLVESAGLSLPKIVGSIEGRNANWHRAITISCQLTRDLLFCVLTYFLARLYFVRLHFCL